MTPFEALFLGALQGVTEFLPISSSGHLLLAESFLGLEYQNLLGFDIVLHTGTLLAIIVYFWKDFINLIKGFLSFFGLFKDNKNIRTYRKEVLYIIVATIPIVVAAFTIKDFMEGAARNPNMVIGLMTFLALYFIFTETIYKKRKKAQLGWGNSIVMGIAQAFAILPGISRSGSIISTGIAQGYNRVKAARFAFLLGIPALGGATILILRDVIDGTAAFPGTQQIIIGFFSSFIVGLLSVRFLMHFLKTRTLIPFAGYLLVLVGVYFLFANGITA